MCGRPGGERGGGGNNNKKCVREKKQQQQIKNTNKYQCPTRERGIQKKGGDGLLGWKRVRENLFYLKSSPKMFHTPPKISSVEILEL